MNGSRPCRQALVAISLGWQRSGEGREGRQAVCWYPPEPLTHRAVLADALAALDGLLVLAQRRLVAVERAQLDVGAKLVVEEATGAVLGLTAAPVLARGRLAVGVQLAELVWGGMEGEEGSVGCWGATTRQMQRGQAVCAVDCRGRCSCRALTPAAPQAAVVVATAVDVRLTGVLDAVVAGGPKGAHIGLALVALAVLAGLAGLLGRGKEARPIC